MIRRAYKTELKPNARQRESLANHAGAARFAYNWGLARKTESYEFTGKTPTAIDLHRELNALKKIQFPWLYEVSKCAPQEALRDLDRAFENFFRRLTLIRQGKHNGKVGFPRFKSKRRGLGSFRLTGSIHAEPGRIKLPRLGWMRLKENGYLPPDGTDGVHALSATVSERAGRWFVSLQVDENLPENEPASGDALGVDLGVKTLATCSDGQTFENPKALYKNTSRLARLQKKLCHQEKGSKRREETRKRIARLHYRIYCIRSDTIHKATSKIAAKAKPPSARPGVVVLEDLNLSGMMKNRRLARAVADASMREFRRQMEYKCSWYGASLLLADRFFPSSKTCSACGEVNSGLKLSERTFTCPACGHTKDRDLNAAVNLSKVAVSSPETLNGRGGDVRPAQSSMQTPEKRQSEGMAHLSSF